MSGAPRRRARRWRVALVMGALVVAVLAGAEIALRLTGGFDVASHETRADLEFAAPCLHVESSARGPVFVRNPTADGTPPGAPVPVERRPGVARVAVVGESNAAILGDALRDGLAGSRRAGAFELLSCGAEGAALSTVEQRFEEVLADRPDVVVVIFAHNFRYDFRPVLPGASALVGHLVGSPLGRALLHSRLVTAFAFAALAWGTPRESPPDPSATAALETRTARALAAMADEARARGVRLVVTTMPANLLLPPAVPTNAPDDATLEEARWREATEGRGVALADLAAAPPTASREFQQGAWLLEARPADAERHLREALRLDVVTPRAPDELNDAVRALASRGAFVWDWQRALDATAPAGIPGFETFDDCCHLAGDRLQATAQALFDAVASALGSPGCALASLGEPSSETAGHLLESAIEAQERRGEATTRDWALAIGLAVERELRRDRAAVERDVAGVEAGEAWRRASAATRATTLRGLALAYRDAGPPDTAYRLNAEAASLQPVRAALQRALWLVADGRRADARAALAPFSADPTAALRVVRRHLAAP